MTPRFRIDHNKSTRQHINKFCDRLNDIRSHEISDKSYQQKYFQYLVSNKKYFIALYAFVLDTIIEHSIKAPDQITLLDCGAGNGLLGIFAKFCGFKQVYINDSDNHFLESAKKLSSKLGIVMDGFIWGDISHIKEDIKPLNIDAIAGTDVIEHIYTLEKFFALLQHVNPDIISVFSTASNPYNYLKKKEITRIQLKDEFIGGKSNDSPLSGPKPLAPFLKIREGIIKEKYQSISDAELKELASLTRGMIKEDVLIAAQEYLTKKTWPLSIKHPTNTCNPLDGSWSERLLTLQEYNSIYKDQGFSLSMKNGFYNEHQNGIKDFALYIFNTIIKYFPSFGKYFSPFILLIGKRTQ